MIYNYLYHCTDVNVNRTTAYNSNILWLSEIIIVSYTLQLSMNASKVEHRQERLLGSHQRHSM